MIEIRGDISSENSEWGKGAWVLYIHTRPCLAQESG